MARIDGREAAQDAMMDVARLAVAAAYRSPQLTGRLELQTEIVTGKDIAPIVEVFEAVHPISPVMYFDYQTLKYYLDRGVEIPIILLGADLTFAEMGWDCGACGHATCGKFNAYCEEEQEPIHAVGRPELQLEAPRLWGCLRFCLCGAQSVPNRCSRHGHGRRRCSDRRLSAGLQRAHRDSDRASGGLQMVQPGDQSRHGRLRDAPRVDAEDLAHELADLPGKHQALHQDEGRLVEQSRVREVGALLTRRTEIRRSDHCEGRRGGQKHVPEVSGWYKKKGKK